MVTLPSKSVLGGRSPAFGEELALPGRVEASCLGRHFQEHCRVGVIAGLPPFELPREAGMVSEPQSQISLAAADGLCLVCVVL